MKKSFLYTNFASLISLGLLASSTPVIAAEVYPGDITTGPPEVLFDISVQPVFDKISSWQAISIIAVATLVILVAIYFTYRIYRKRKLTRVNQMNETK